MTRDTQMKNDIIKLWPEIDWIKDKNLAEKVAKAWAEKYDD